MAVAGSSEAVKVIIRCRPFNSREKQLKSKVINITLIWNDLDYITLIVRVTRPSWVGDSFRDNLHFIPLAKLCPTLFLLFILLFHFKKNTINTECSGNHSVDAAMHAPIASRFDHKAVHFWWSLRSRLDYRTDLHRFRILFSRSIQVTTHHHLLFEFLF